MRPYFFDASAIAKLVINERGSDAVKALCRRPIVRRTTWLSLAEVYGIIKRRWRKEKWEEGRYYRKLWDLQKSIQEDIEIDGPVNLPNSKFRELKRIHDAYHLDFSDALHLVLLRSGLYAHLAGKSKPVLVASDRRLLKAARKEGILTWNPEKDKLPSESEE
jgi:predicted nucleic acid-binding protein